MAKYIFLTGAALAVSVSFCTGSKSSTSNPSQPEVPSAIQGQVNVTRLYDDTCSKCHGNNGQGGGAGTQTLNTVEKFDQKNDKPFFDAIKNGVPNQGMEAYGGSLSDTQIWALVVHIRELQAKALRAQNGDPKAVGGVYHSQRHNFKLETVVDTGLSTPWAIDWLPDGKMLVTNRPGYMLVYDKGKPGFKVDGLPETREMGQGGLMDVAVHPEYAKNGWIYLSFSDIAQGVAFTKVVRGKIQFSGDTAKWSDQHTIFEVPKEFYSGAGHHFGSRIVFDKKGHVFIAIGERGTNMRVQDLSTPYGKVYRLNEDGTEPADNPFVGQSGVFRGIWSYGHRNQQAMTMDLDGNLWVTEHGPRGGDEVNKIDKGANYGWPVVAFSINYNDTPFQIPWPKPDQKFTLPAFRWLPSIGASGMDVVSGKAFPSWKGDLIAGGLSGANVDRMRMKGGVLVEREELLHGLGRVREIAVGPDGSVYVALNQPDKVIRLVPAP